MSELELLPPHQRHECPVCHKMFSHLERCKDKIRRCGNCKKKMVTNPFYNPDWFKRKNYVGVRNISDQERSLLMTNKIKTGMTYTKAKEVIERDINQVKKIKPRTFKPQSEAVNLQLHPPKDTANKKLTEGLGLEKA